MENLLLFRGNEFNANFFHHAKIDVDHSFYLKCGKKEILIVPKLNERVARHLFSGTVLCNEKPLDEIIRLMKGKELALDYSSLPAKIYEKLVKIIKTRNFSEKFLKFRAAKKPEELEKIKKAVSLTKKIFSLIEISEFKDEKSLNDWLHIRTFELGTKPAFDPIVCSGIHSTFPHYKPSHSRIKNFILVDYGVKYENYCSDITRMFFTSREKKVFDSYEIIQSIFYEIIDEFPNFENGGEVALFSEKLFKKYRLPKPIHSIGHGVGLDIHEYPRLNKKYKDEIKGTVMAVEPAAYFRDFGVRFEETIYFDGKKVKIL